MTAGFIPFTLFVAYQTAAGQSNLAYVLGSLSWFSLVAWLMFLIAGCRVELVGADTNRAVNYVFAISVHRDRIAKIHASEGLLITLTDGSELGYAAYGSSLGDALLGHRRASRAATAAQLLLAETGRPDGGDQSPEPRDVLRPR